MEDISADLERFDADFKPGGGRRPGVASLTDGEYDFRITAVETARVGKDKTPIVRLILQVLTKGQHYGEIIEHAYFLSDLDKVDSLGSDLVTLGIDADKWKSTGRKFSVELPGALEKIVGVCFMGKKEAKQGEKKVFQNLYLKERVTRSDFPPLPNGTGDSTPSETTEEIPF